MGSLYGALGGTDDKNNPGTPAEHRELARSDRPRTSGVLVGVAVPAPALQADAVRILREQGATDIEHTEGTIIAGNWNDFDPLKPLQLVSMLLLVAASVSSFFSQQSAQSRAPPRL